VLNVELLELLRRVGVVPVVTPPSSEKTLPLCAALKAGEIPVIEVTFRAGGAADAVAIIRDRAPEICVGVGTVTSRAQVRQAKAAGAQFAVAPGLNPEVVACAQDVDLPFVPGVCTPSEIERAMDMGLSLLKFFPAGALGGAKTVKAMLAPYLHLGLQLIPTGGIDDDTAASYWGLDGVAAIGGTWIAPPDLVKTGDWAEITRRASTTSARYRAIRAGNA
jgi:2-dehydro-3-deoxyphosphogluconate aldolase/(4S)-4-hydroxy-2-oxoglutarate aldolase